MDSRSLSAEDRVALILGRSIMKIELLTVHLEGLQTENQKLNDTLNENERDASDSTDGTETASGDSPTETT
jgi:hypothetical protein